MKIVDSPRPVSKAEQYRQVAREIAGQDKAAYFDKESDFKTFSQIARDMGLKPRSQKMRTGGWRVWC